MTEKGFNKLNFSLPLSMETAVPVDYNSFFRSYEDAVIAASNATSAGGNESVYYIGQILTVVDDDSRSVKNYIIKHDKTIEEISLKYTFTNGLTSSSTEDGDGRRKVGLSESIFNEIDTTYNTLRSTSATWQSTNTTVKETSANWQNVRTEVESASSDFHSLYSTVEETSGKWEENYSVTQSVTSDLSSVYSTVETNSAIWGDGINTLQSVSSDWNNVRSEVESASAGMHNLLTTVEETSATWNSGYTIANRLMNATSEDLWEIEGNQIADKNYVQGLIETSVNTFRGSFGIWDEVPTTSDGYMEDIFGKRIPQQNDYIIVFDCTGMKYPIEVKESIVGEVLAENVLTKSGDILFFAGRILEENDITILRNNGIESVVIQRRGTWRFKFVGKWVDGEIGKSRWKAEYKINDSPLTNEQLAALNSGITSEYVAQIKKNRNSIDSISAVSGDWNDATTSIRAITGDTIAVNTQFMASSASWNTVTEKIDKSFFHYYTLASWNELTRDETDYSRVPVGMIYIYEDGEEPPVPPYGEMSVFTIADSMLKLADNIMYDSANGFITFADDATLDENNTLTIPGSSDGKILTTYDYVTGVLDIMNDAVYSESDGMLTLRSGVDFIETAGLLELDGHGINAENIVNVYATLIDVNSSNPIKQLSIGDSWTTTLTPKKSDYRIAEATCTMNGKSIAPASGYTYSIPNVTGNIEIYARAYEIPEYTISNTLTHVVNSNTSIKIKDGETYEAIFTTDEGYELKTLTCSMGGASQTAYGNSIFIESVTGNIVITAIAEEKSSTFDTDSGLLTLSPLTVFDENDIVNLSNSTFDSILGILQLNGNSEIPLRYFNVINSLSHVTNSNVGTNVLRNSRYSAELTAEDGYEIVSIRCIMGELVQPVVGHTITIENVTGDIQIIATAVRIDGEAAFNDTDGILMLPPSTTVDLLNVVSFGTSVECTDDGVMTMVGRSLSD